MVCPCGWVGHRTKLTNTLCPQCGQNSAGRPTLQRVDLPGEEWREIPGFGGNYLASNMGRIFSVQRRRTTGGIISQHLGTGGYLGALLYRGDKASGRIHSVHRLVLAAFVGECPDGMESLHGDGDQQNNRIENLRWGTHAENTADQIRHRKARTPAIDAMSEEEAESLIEKATGRKYRYENDTLTNAAAKRAVLSAGQSRAIDDEGLVEKVLRRADALSQMYPHPAKGLNLQYADRDGHWNIGEFARDIIKAIRG